MVTCPRCQQPVDETVRTTCPLCFTPIAQASHASGPLAGLSHDPAAVPGNSPHSHMPPAEVPLPLYQQPGMQQQPMMPESAQAPRPLLNPGARVSLTGEVIESGGSSSAPPSYVGGGGPIPPGRGPQPAPGARAKSPMMRPQEEAPQKTGSGAVGIVVMLLVLVGGVVGGYFWMMNRTNPKDQARAVYNAVLTQDYKSAYELTALSPEAQKKYPSADAFAADAGKYADKLGARKETIMESVKAAAATAKVGEASITGDKAEVPTSCTISILGREYQLKGTAHMKNEFGFWKLDRSGEGDTTSSQTFVDLVGKPSM